MNLQHRLVDRDNEVNSLINSISNQRAKIDIIYAKSGVGKTSLVKKLMYKLSELNIPNVILINTLPVNSYTTSNEWLYIDLIFETFQKYFAQDDRYNFQQFLSSGDCNMVNWKRREKSFEQISSASSIKQFLWSSVVSIVAQAQNMCQLNPYSISTDNSMSSRSIKAQYVSFILKKQRIVFIMDNVQNIDGTSLKFLLEWINETKSLNHYFLFQYTITENTSATNLDELREALSDTGVYVECTELSNMSSNYIVDIIDNQAISKPPNIRFNIDALQHYEKYSDGNIRELLDYVQQYKIEKKCDFEKYSATANLINNLSPEAKCILAILVFSNGELPKTALFTIWEKYFASCDIAPLINELSNANIISQNTDPAIISVAHGYVIDEWESNLSLFSGIDRMVYNRLVTLCVHNLKKPSNSDILDSYKAWQYLLQMYAKREPDKIFSMLEYLESGLICEISPSNIWRYMDLVIKCTETKISMYTAEYYKMLSICYKLELFHEGMSCIEKMERYFPLEDNHLLILYKINYLTGLDRFDDAITLYQWASKFISQTDAYWFHLNLCILCSYRSINRIEDCKQIGQQLRVLNNMRERTEYAYYMRLMNIYLPNSRALKYAKWSAEWFQRHGDNYQAGKSYITYSKLLASIGNYKKAIKYSEIAQHLLDGHMETSHFLLSNLAAYKLLNGEPQDDIWELLNQAELSASVPYSRLAIIVNKLAWCYEQPRRLFLS